MVRSLCVRWMSGVLQYLYCDMAPPLGRPLGHGGRRLKENDVALLPNSRSRDRLSRL